MRNKTLQEPSLEVINTKLTYISADVAEIKQTLKADYVTNQEFEPIKKIVYGMISVILLAVIGAMVALVLR